MDRLIEIFIYWIGAIILVAVLKFAGVEDFIPMLIMYSTIFIIANDDDDKGSMSGV